MADHLGRGLQPIVRFLLTPEDHSAVVSCSCKNLPGGVPVHPVNCLRVGLLDPMKQPICSIHLCSPKSQSSLWCCACEEFFFVWVPSYNLDLVIVAFKAVYLVVSFPKVINFNLAIFASRQKPITIYWVPSYTVNHRMWSSNLIPALAAGSRIPNLNSLILTASYD